MPLLVPRSRGGLGIDLTSTTRAGYLERRFDEDLPDEDYAAWRLETDTRIHAAGSAGDVRLSGYAGVDAAQYLGRDDGGDDLLRAGLIAGLRANLQAHRAWDVRGGFFRLDGLRHVVDLDVEGLARWYERDPGAEEVPWFDLTDQEVERTQGLLRVRNRLQTRATGGGLRDVVDLELTGRWYVDEVTPWGGEVPGEIDYALRARPRERWLVGGEGRYDVGSSELYRASIGTGVEPSDRLTFFTGVRYVRDEALQVGFDVGWRWSEKYGVRLRESYDFEGEYNRVRLVFGRYSADHAIFFGVNARGTDDFGVELDFQPTLGSGGPQGRRVFSDQPDIDPWEYFE